NWEGKIFLGSAAENTALGNGALSQLTGGSRNTAIGETALFENTAGSFNTAIGDAALLKNETGSQNTATGNAALFGNATGSQNTATGEAALFHNLTGSFNVALGFEAGYAVTGSNNIDISNSGQPGEESTTRIGKEDSKARAFIAGIFGKTPAGETCSVGV